MTLSKKRASKFGEDDMKLIFNLQSSILILTEKIIAHIYPRTMAGSDLLTQGRLTLTHSGNRHVEDWEALRLA